jgi:FlaA1/EpsC-like NDP-sugar epimerase
MFSGRAFACRTLFLCLVYSSVLCGSLLLAYQLRFDFAVPAQDKADLTASLAGILLLKLTLLVYFRQFSGLLSFFSLPDLLRLTHAMLLSTFLILLPTYIAEVTLIPRGVLLLDLVLSLTGLAAARIGVRLLRERRFANRGKAQRKGIRVGIIGAGDAGASLVRELGKKSKIGLVPVAFFDDDPEKWSCTVHDVPVVGAPNLLATDSALYGIEEVIIAMPSAPQRRVAEIVKLLQKTSLKFATVPSLDQLASGKVKVSNLRSVEIADLLGRDAVELDNDNIEEILRDSVVMVTGAGGSIGSELCRQIARFNPRQVLLVEQSEVQLFPIEQELQQIHPRDRIVPLIADILDAARMRQIFEEYRPDILFHAAAHKHVPLMELHPGEAVKNNIFGTAHLADLANDYRLQRFILISSDKAVNPTNVMGATKRVSEVYLQALYNRFRSGTKFMAVRFGNVLGSSGSVVPTFIRQIAAGGPITVTHPDVTRYFMTIPEAVGLVLQSASQGEGGEIFVLDMGEPIKIVDLARHLILLNGLRPNEDIEIKFTGLRPGEKLYEELSHCGEGIASTHHPKVRRFICSPPSLDFVSDHIRQLRTAVHAVTPHQIKLMLQAVVPEYEPFLPERSQGPAPVVQPGIQRPPVLAVPAGA